MRWRRGHKPPKLASFYAAIRQRAAERGDTTIEELRAWLLATRRVAASVGLIWHTLRLLGLTLKKVASSRRAGSAGCRRGARGMGVGASRRLIRPG